VECVQACGVTGPCRRVKRGEKLTTSDAMLEVAGRSRSRMPEQTYRESREPMISRFLGTNVPFLGAHPVEVINESCTEREIRLKYVSLMLYSIAISHEQTTKLSLR